MYCSTGGLQYPIFSAKDSGPYLSVCSQLNKMSVTSKFALFDYIPR